MSQELKKKKKALNEWIASIEDERLLDNLLMVKEETATYTPQLSNPEIPLTAEEVSAIEKGLNSPHPTISRVEAKKSYAKYL